MRDLRLRMRFRQAAAQRTQCKNRIHAVLVSNNLVCPMADLFAAGEREWLGEKLVQLRPTVQEVIAHNLALIDRLN